MTPCCDITISDAGSTLNLGPFASHGEFSFTCRNLLGRSFPGLVELIGVADGGGSSSSTLPSWISADGKQEFDVDATLVVAVRAQLPAGSPAQRIKLKLRVSNELSPNEEYAESRVVTVEVESAKPQAPPKWLIPVLALCCALIAIGGALVWFLSGAKLGDACDPKNAKCPADSACLRAAGVASAAAANTSTQCLLPTGVACQKPGECWSGDCDKLCQEPRAAVGKDCEPIAHRCAEGAECIAKKCLANLGQGCTSGADCVSARCSKNRKCIPPAKGTTVKFASDETWSSYAADDNGKSGGDLGKAKLVCESVTTPANCPAEALHYAPTPGGGWQADLSIDGAKWIWRADTKEDIPPETVAFEKSFDLGPDPNGAIRIAADDFAEVRVNGTVLATIGSIVDATQATDAQKVPHPIDLTPALHEGPNVITIIGKNGPWKGCEATAPIEPVGLAEARRGGLDKAAVLRNWRARRAAGPPDAPRCWSPAGVIFSGTLSD